MWGLGAVLYLYGFFQRVAPGVMGEELARTFDLNAAALGNLSAFYFYSYVAMQIPTGLLADTLGPRRLLAAGAVVSAAGTVVFALAPDGVVASIGRLLVGASVAVAFVGMLKLAGTGCPHNLYAPASGIALLAGIGGAVFAGVPLQAAMAAFGWRDVMLAGGVFVAVVGVVIFMVVRDDPTARGYASHAAENPRADARSIGFLSGLGQVFRYRNTILLTLVPGGIVGCLLTFSGLWGQPFLTTHHGFTATGAAAVNTALLVAWAVGGPLFGWFSDRIRQRRLPYVVGVWVALVGWLLCGLRARTAGVAVDRGARCHRLLLRQHGPRVRLRQGVGAAAIRRHGLGDRQHGSDVGTDDHAAGGRRDARPPLHRRHRNGRAYLRPAGLPGRLSA
ncbi:MAG: MFS transporter [Gammaproteobacteria bacterium]|nr:MFS transporter [Gammaproteobacteria bacterium]